MISLPELLFFFLGEGFLREGFFAVLLLLLFLFAATV